MMQAGLALLVPSAIIRTLLSRLPMTAGHGSNVSYATTSGLPALMDCPMQPTPSPQRPDIRWRWIIPKQPVMRIDNWKKWQGLMRQVLDMPDEARVEVLYIYRDYGTFLNENANPSRLKYSAEHCLECAIRDIYDKYSPTKAGADEYADIMEANAELWWTNREIDRGK
jgi:hypothetical protein